MPHTEIYLVRHGLPEYPLDSQGRKLFYDSTVPLSKQGRLHVHELSTKIPQLDVIYSSPFKRTMETAAILAQEQGAVNVIEYPALGDIYSRNGKGKLLDDILAGNVPIHPEDESIDQLNIRVLQGFEEILQKEKGKKVGIVSHGHPIRLIVWKYVEGHSEAPQNMQELVAYNYPLQAEAWVLIWNENGELHLSYLLPREDNEAPGTGKW